MNRCDEQLLMLLRFALELDDSFALQPTAEEWVRLYEESIRHSLVGVTFVGVNRLRGEQRPPLELLMQWASEAEALREVNLRFNREAARLGDKPGKYSKNAIKSTNVSLLGTVNLSKTRRFC